MGPQLFIPSPVGMVITVGKWIWDVSTQEQVYYIEVAGEGATVAEAKNNGFRLAVEQAIGTIIASESEANNGQLTRDEIISYASGHVDKFEIASQQATPIGVQTVMKVWVRRSSLSNRLLNRSEKVGEVDGARASVQLSTIGAERATGDQLVASVLRDFPKRAFDIDLKNTELKYGNRQGVLEVPFRLSWNKDYLASLWAALEATAQKSSNPMSQVSISPGGWFRGFGGTARYDDYAKYTLVNSVLVGSRPAVLITIKNAGNRAISRQCYFWPELDHNDGYVVRPNKFVFIAPYGNSTTINGGFRLDAVALIPTTPELLATASRVDIDIVPKISCPN
jgi:NOL1/NOP2/fmu family ribosome biogenesis protein